MLVRSQREVPGASQGAVARRVPHWDRPKKLDATCHRAQILHAVRVPLSALRFVVTTVRNIVAFLALPIGRIENQTEKFLVVDVGARLL